jgi:phosphoribosyl-ATP pyrophosphohydrolase
MINLEADFNVTNQTVTFPVPLNKLKGLLMENIGKTIKTPDGDVKITLRNVLNIVDNSKPSMYNINKCFIYNKKLSQLENTEHNSAQHSEPNVCTDNLLPFPLLQETIDETNVYDLIRKWAYDKGILNSGDSKTQYVKLIEEGGELARAILKKDKPEIIDAIGDMIVVLTNLAALEGLKVEDCVVSAYDVIKNRTGKMQNGSFVKETL